MWDAIIVGGGTAGLSAALVLGRARRRVLVLDGGSPRNEPAAEVHGFFTRDGISPLQLLEIGREQLAPYTSVQIRATAAVDVTHDEDGFSLRLADGSHERGQKLLLASGVVDDVPAIPGMRELWGRGVHHCPYCHGWEVRDQTLAIYARGHDALHYIRTLLGWSRDLVVCTDGASEGDAEMDRRLREWGVRVRHEPILRLEGRSGKLERVVFQSGDSLACSALFVRPAQRPRSDLAERLGCATAEMMGIRSLQVDEMGQTSVAGVYAAGDVRRAAQSVMFAAADGALAAIGINTALAVQDYGEL